jgi:mannose-6-phosphate isomerase-like protein (cupin superfamily)
MLRRPGSRRSCCGPSQRRVIPISDYTVVNLKEVDNSAGDNAALEAHFGRKHLDSEHLGVSLFRAGPGFRSEKGHSHREQEEVYIVVAGSGRIKLNDEIVELRLGTRCASRRLPFARSKPALTAWSSSPLAPTAPRAATECKPRTSGTTRSAKGTVATVAHQS